MMGVYIKGVEIPFTCLSCDFHKCAGGAGDYCTLTKKKQFRFKNRPSYCPLVPVPEPHGRLIEKNAIFKLIQSMPSVDKLLPVEFMKALQEIPTVIPAEEDEMYEDLVKRLKTCISDTVEDCAGCPYQGGYKGTYCMNGLIADAADAIEKLNRYAAQMDKLREDGWYLLQETDGTYGPITMKMPIPEPLSCDDVLAIINGEPPKEE